MYLPGIRAEAEGAHAKVICCIYEARMRGDKNLGDCSAVPRGTSRGHCSDSKPGGSSRALTGTRDQSRARTLLLLGCTGLQLSRK